MDDAAAEDATQETFLRVHRHLDKVPMGSESLIWIFRVATNICLNQIRQRSVRSGLLDTRVAVEPDKSFEELLADREFILRLVERLPRRLSVPAWLHYVDGLDQTEVARTLGVTRRTVVNRLAAFAELARKRMGPQP
jgi:RNA polymerase sigma-70 factor (ECF subfamily)